MPSILLIATPPGEAPLEVRAAWVGVALKIVPGNDAKPRRYDVVGIHAKVGGLGWKIRKFLHLPQRGQEVWLGYEVELLHAVRALEAAGRTEAALWWTTNVPHLLRPGQTVIFPASSCQLVEQADI